MEVVRIKRAILIVSCIFISSLDHAQQSLFGQYIGIFNTGESSVVLNIDEDGTFDEVIYSNLGGKRIGAGKYRLEGKKKLILDFKSFPDTVSSLYNVERRGRKSAISSYHRVKVMYLKDSSVVSDLPIIQLMNNEKKEIIQLSTDENGILTFNLKQDVSLLSNLRLRWIGYHSLDIDLSPNFGYSTNIDIYMAEKTQYIEPNVITYSIRHSADEIELFSEEQNFITLKKNNKQ